VAITEWWFVNTATIITAQLVQFALCCKNLIITKVPTMLILSTLLMNTYLLTHSAVNVIEHRGSWVETTNKERWYTSIYKMWYGNHVVKITQQLSHRWKENFKSM
jgi:hypothetical protein